MIANRTTEQNIADVWKGTAVDALEGWQIDNHSIRFRLVAPNDEFVERLPGPEYATTSDPEMAVTFKTLGEAEEIVEKLKANAERLGITGYDCQVETQVSLEATMPWSPIS